MVSDTDTGITLADVDTLTTAGGRWLVNTGASPHFGLGGNWVKC